jgi:hypothetical protein
LGNHQVDPDCALNRHLLRSQKLALSQHQGVLFKAMLGKGYSIDNHVAAI